MTYPWRKAQASNSRNEYQKILEENVPKNVHDLLIENVRGFSSSIRNKIEEGDIWKSKYLELERKYEILKEELPKTIHLNHVENKMDFFLIL